MHIYSPHVTTHAMVGALVLQPMVGHAATRLLGDAPREYASARIAHIQRFVVLGDGERGDAGRLRVVLAIVGGVHGQLGAEHQLALPFEACELQFMND